MSVSPNFLFSVKYGKPVVLRRDGVTQIPSFDEDWERANRSTAPTDYHADITSVRRSFRADISQHKKVSKGNTKTSSSSSGPSLTTHAPSANASAPRALPSTPPSSIASPMLDSDSEIEVSGNIHFTPTGTSITFLKRTASLSSSDDQNAKRPRYLPPPHFSPPADDSSSISSPSLPPRAKRAAKQGRSNGQLTKQIGYAPPPLPSSPPLQFPSVSPYGSSRISSVGRRSPASSSYMRSPSPSSESPTPPMHSSRPRKENPWHHGLYCVEFAEGLSAMEVNKLSQEEAFHDAFPNRPWVRRTFQDNKKQWLDLASPSDRSAAVSAGRTCQGLWCRFSKLHPIPKSSKK